MSDDNLVSRVYSGFRGVDFRGEEINLVRSPDSVNVWKDYKETDSIRTRPELELLASFDAPVYGIYFIDNEIRIHSGTSLYREVDNGVSDKFMQSIDNRLNPTKSDGFTYKGKLYIKDGVNFFVNEGIEVTTLGGVSSHSYIPTTSIGRIPAGGGTVHEDVNLLNAYRKNSFLGDGTSTEYFLDTQGIGNVTVTVNDEKLSNTLYEVDSELGKITFNTAPSAPLTDGQDNVIIQFSKVVEGHAEQITNCTLLQVFDNRVFFSGNPNYPNRIWHSSLHDPTYCSDLDYYDDGMFTSQVKGLAAGNNALWVFKEPSEEDETIFYHVPTIDGEYGKIYPSSHSTVATGCVGKAINFNDDIAFFSERGMEGINGDVTTEQVIAHRSSLIDRKLLSETGYKDMLLEEWEGYLIVFIDDKAYLADSRATFANENHYEYEWFYWELGKKVTCTKVKDGVLYIGTEDGVYTLTDTLSAVNSHWTTPIDKFKYPQYLKTTNKRGCVVEATGDISVHVKTEKTDFELIGEYKDITDYFVSRIKRKKFKNIQLKFSSDKRFSLESATLECFIGGYIKR